MLRQFQVPFVSWNGGPFQSRSRATHNSHTLFAEAQAYLHLFCQERSSGNAFSRRCTEIQLTIEQSEMYQHIFAELEYGVCVAWRNSVRCIGGLQWQALVVRDPRHLSRAEDIFAALVEHLPLATKDVLLNPTSFIKLHPGKNKRQGGQQM